MKRALRHQWVRFVLVGCVNTAFSYSVYSAFLFMGMAYAAANFMSLIIGILFSFRTQSTLVFENSSPRLLLRFVLAWIGIYVINIGVISLLLRTGLNAYQAGALALLPVTALSYVIQKFGVFHVARPGAANGSR